MTEKKKLAPGEGEDENPTAEQAGAESQSDLEAQNIVSSESGAQTDTPPSS